MRRFSPLATPPDAVEPLSIRAARRFDAGAMAALLTSFPAHAGPPVDPVALRGWIDGGGIWHLAERGAELRGFQWLGPRDALPPDTFEIATFIDPGEAGIAAGSALFDATRRAARMRGIARIVAKYPHANAGARAYYGSRGFEDAGPALTSILLAGRPDGHDRVMVFGT